MWLGGGMAKEGQLEQHESEFDISHTSFQIHVSVGCISIKSHLAFYLLRSGGLDHMGNIYSTCCTASDPLDSTLKHLLKYFFLFFTIWRTILPAEQLKIERWFAGFAVWPCVVTGSRGDILVCGFIWDSCLAKTLGFIISMGCTCVVSQASAGLSRPRRGVFFLWIGVWGGQTPWLTDTYCHTAVRGVQQSTLSDTMQGSVMVLLLLSYVSLFVCVCVSPWQYCYYYYFVYL